MISLTFICKSVEKLQTGNSGGNLNSTISSFCFYLILSGIIFVCLSFLAPSLVMTNSHFVSVFRFLPRSSFEFLFVLLSVTFVLFFFFFCIVLRQINPSSSSVSSAGREGGREWWRERALQWMSIPVVSEVTAAQRSYWQQYWTPQFAHTGMRDIVTSFSHTEIDAAEFLKYTL